MKKFLIVFLFLGFFIGVISFTNMNSNKNENKVQEKNIEKSRIATPLQANTGTEVKRETVGGDHYELWRNEAKSESLNPTNLDEIKKTDNNQTKNYVNSWFGYSLNFPTKWEIDNHQVPYYTRFFTKDFRIDITVQNVEKAWTSPRGYISNTIDNIKNNITNEKSWSHQNLKVRRIDYTRPLIKEVKNDLNYYSYYFVTKGNHVFTFQLKTNKASFVTLTKQMNELINSFEVFNMLETDLNRVVKEKDMNHEVSLKHDNKSLIIPKNKFLMGVYLPKPRDIENLNKFTNNHIGAQMFYKPIDSDYDMYVTELLEGNRLPMVTFLFERTNKEKHHDVVTSILKGEFDDNLLNWSQGIQNTKGPVLLRLGNEMNGSWSDWSHKYNYNDPDLYKLSFKYIVELFKRDGTDNAYFVWNPNNVSSPYYEWNAAAMYYPGDKYVDFVGMTSYNFGKTQYNDFRYFETLYDELYWDYSRSYSSKSLIIGEFGSVEFGGDKGRWIKEVFDLIPSKYSNIKMAVWFDEAHAQYDLRLRTSEKSGNAFKNGMDSENVVKYLKDNTKN